MEENISNENIIKFLEIFTFFAIHNVKKIKFNYSICHIYNILFFLFVVNKVNDPFNDDLKVFNKF